MRTVTNLPPLLRAGAALVVVAVACSDPTSPTSPVSTRSAARSASVDTGAAVLDTAVLLAAGDIADCSNDNDESTARLLDQRPVGTVLTLGDNAYEDGTAAQFADCYAPTWGRHRARTRPAPGNHDYLTAGAAPYYAYFDTLAGPAGRGYYSFDAGTWHVVSLNSNVDVSDASAQVRWLRADLAAHPAPCTVAYFHHPRFSSGWHGSSSAMRPVWQALYDGGADVVLSGHDHDYERFAPQTPDGAADPARGIREFVVGTGGKNIRPFPGAPAANSEFRDGSDFGILKLKTTANGYHWSFITAAGSRPDTGSAPCH